MCSSDELYGGSTAAVWNPQVGDTVCDCRYLHQRIVERDGDDLVLEDGSHCSLKHCCDPPDHEWGHGGR